jgi:hypothetical protein
MLVLALLSPTQVKKQESQAKAAAAAAKATKA